MRTCSHRTSAVNSQMNGFIMAHHETIMCQELRSNKGVIVYANISSLLDFVRTLAYPFIIKTSGVRLHTFVTEDVINDEIMIVFEDGEKIQREGLLLRHRSNNNSQNYLPKCDTVVHTKPNTASYTTTSKVLTAAQRDAEIARERGVTVEEVLSHDHFLTSHLFDGDYLCHTRQNQTRGSVVGIYRRWCWCWDWIT